MASSPEKFDFEQARKEIRKEQKSSRILYAISFVVEALRILAQNQNQEASELLADKALEALKGDEKLKKVLLLHFIKLNSGPATDKRMFKYLTQIEHLLTENEAEKSARVEVLLEIADSCRLSGEHENALEYGLKAMRITTEIKDHIAEVRCLNSLGLTHEKLGQYDKARTYFKKWLEISTAGGDQEGMAMSNNNLGNICVSSEEYEKAIVFYTEGLKISTATGDRKEIANINCNLGNAYAYLGEFKKAIEYYRKGLEFSTAIGHREGIVSNNCNLGNSFLNLGEYEKAIDCFVKCLEMYTITGNHEGVAGSTCNLGDVYRRLGDYEKAIDHYKKSLEISTAIGARLLRATTNTDLGITYRDLGEYEIAIEYCKKGLELSRAIDNREGIANSIGILGNIYLRIGQFNKAIDYLQKCLEINTAISNRSGIATANGDLGNVYRYLGEDEVAIDYYKKGLEIFTATGNRKGEANINGNMGTAYLCLGTYERALHCFNKSLDISIAVGDCEGIASNNANLGLVFLGLGEYEKSIVYSEKASEIASEIDNPSLEGSCLGIVGLAHFWKGLSTDNHSETFFQQAASYLTKSIRCRDKIVSKLSLDQNRIWFTKEYFNRHVVLMYSFIILERLEAALLVIDLGKANALRAFMEKQSNFISDDEIDYSRKTFYSIDAEKETIQTNEIQKNLKLKDGSISVLYFAFDSWNSLNIWVLNGHDAIAHFLVKESFLSMIDNFAKNVEISLSRDASFYKLISHFGDGSLFVYPVQLLPCLKDENCSNDEAIGNADNFRESENNATVNSESVHDSVVSADIANEEILQKLFYVLIDPLKQSLKGNKLIIVPDKSLFFLPFCALTDRNGCRLTQDYSIQVTPSLHTLVTGMKRCPNSSLGFALFVGNPTLGRISLRGVEVDLPSLPGASEEVTSLADNYFDTKPLVQDQATKTNVLKLIGNASIIHIAAHGEPVHGEILLGPDASCQQHNLAPHTEKCYLLRQHDVMGISLNANLVVLCCCRTGQGEISNEGVVGLARAFLAAGVHSVIAILWPIDDRGTKEFMVYFYDELCRETSVCDALRKSMNFFQKHPNEEFRSFKIWSPFVVYGEDVKFTENDIEEIKQKSREMSYLF